MAATPSVDFQTPFFVPPPPRYVTLKTICQVVLPIILGLGAAFAVYSITPLFNLVGVVGVIVSGVVVAAITFIAIYTLLKRSNQVIRPQQDLTPKPPSIIFKDKDGHDIDFKKYLDVIPTTSSDLHIDNLAQAFAKDITNIDFAVHANQQSLRTFIFNVINQTTLNDFQTPLRDSALFKDSNYLRAKALLSRIPNEVIDPEGNQEESLVLQALKKGHVVVAHLLSTLFPPLLLRRKDDTQQDGLDACVLFKENSSIARKLLLAFLPLMTIEDLFYELLERNFVLICAQRETDFTTKLQFFLAEQPYQAEVDVSKILRKLEDFKKNQIARIDLDAHLAQLERNVIKALSHFSSDAQKRIILGSRQEIIKLVNGNGKEVELNRYLNAGDVNAFEIEIADVDWSNNKNIQSINKFLSRMVNETNIRLEDLANPAFKLHEHSAYLRTATFFEKIPEQVFTQDFFEVALNQEKFLLAHLIGKRAPTAKAEAFATLFSDWVDKAKGEISALKDKFYELKLLYDGLKNMGPQEYTAKLVEAQKILPKATHSLARLAIKVIFPDKSQEPFIRMVENCDFFNFYNSYKDLTGLFEGLNKAMEAGSSRLAQLLALK